MVTAQFTKAFCLSTLLYACEISNTFVHVGLRSRHCPHILFLCLSLTPLPSVLFWPLNTKFSKPLVSEVQAVSLSLSLELLSFAVFLTQLCPKCPDSWPCLLNSFSFSSIKHNILDNCTELPKWENISTICIMQKTMLWHGITTNFSDELYAEN